MCLQSIQKHILEQTEINFITQEKLQLTRVHERKLGSDKAEILNEIYHLLDVWEVATSRGHLGIHNREQCHDDFSFSK